MYKQVVFHGDDFGLTEGINHGIVEAFNRGVLRSTSLVVTGSAVEHAMQLAHRNPGLDIGFHVTLVEERSAADPSTIPSLVDSRGCFWPNSTAVFRRWMTGQWRLADVEKELAAQWSRFEEFGLRASHVDGHQHLHALPGVLRSVVESAQARDVPFVRGWFPESARGPRLSRSLRFLALRAVSWWSWRTVPTRDRLRPVLTLGFMDSGGIMQKTKLLDLLDWAFMLHPGVLVEVMLHPGFRDTETHRRYDHWGFRWGCDYALLCDKSLPGELAARGIKVTSFREARDG